MNLEKLMNLGIVAALNAGERILEIYENEDFGIDYKSDESPLTLADTAAHEIIDEILKASNIPVLSEEGKNIPYDVRKEWNHLWIVDPIDGTKEFIKRNGEFTINIALIVNQVPVIGVIYVPVLKEIYFSNKEIGSFKTERIDHSVSVKEIPKKAKKLPLNSTRDCYTVVASRSHLSQETVDFIDELKKEHGTVESLSKGSSLKLCMVAEGAADCYPRFAPTMEWDTAAGHAICKYAGFMVEDVTTGKEMIYNRPNLLNNWFLVKKL